MTDLVVSDVDGALLAGNTQKHFLRFVRHRSLVATAPYYGILGWFAAYRLGLARDARPIMEYAFSFLRGWQEDDVTALADECFEQSLAPRIYRDARRLLADHHHAGRRLVLLSMVPGLLLEPLARRFGADVIATRLECKDGVLTGRIDGPVLSGRLKQTALEAYVRSRHVERTYGYGNDASDVAYLAGTTHPHAVNPDRTLARAAERHRWPVLRFEARGMREAED